VDLEQLMYTRGGKRPADGVVGGDQTQADVGFAGAVCDVDEGRHGIRFQDAECTQIEHDCPGCRGELAAEHVLQTGCRPVVKTPARMDHRHTGPEMIEVKRKDAERAGRPIGIRAHGNRIPRCW
jgi:hypothetical protein